jgi:hypothetical protein
MPTPSRIGTRTCSVTTADVAGRQYRSQAGADGSFDTPPPASAPVEGPAPAFDAARAAAPTRTTMMNPI